MTLEGLSQLTSFCSINNNEVMLEDSPTVTFNGKVAFPRLEMIKISDMNGLEMIWHNQLAEDSFCSLKSVIVIDCNKLLTMCKFNMLERFTKLESLLVYRCNSLEEIFDLQEVNLEKWSHSTVSSQLRELDLRDLQKMRHIWNKDPQRKLSFQKLNKVRIENCWSLENIFPASIARNLSQLEQLYIDGCRAMENIVAEEEGADLEAVTRFDFPRLTSLKLIDLYQLRYFYPGGHTAEWPALNKLSMGDSLRLISQDQFSEHLIPKLKFMKVNDGESVIPPDILWRFPNLKKLEFSRGSFEEIFSLEEVEKHAERPAQIKCLVLYGLEKMERIWKQHSKLDLIIHKLEILHVENAESSEEDGAGPSTQHQVLQNTESSEEDGSGLSTQDLVLENEESSEEDGAGPSTQHLE
ncbi:hypothetical protein Dsin_024209 [Dipteronia sinensis]|uniref:Disease resistance protein At4g27190-like leucine-rich repeats domain-containing protein n=1 Tax=Dipteronia sinensis TaxID=43782 RepID=A0AAE0A516_9ROSI|nr:hypothetical protein Dsin_024209 [Dipteronia sinensis]